MAAGSTHCTLRMTSLSRMPLRLYRSDSCLIQALHLAIAVRRRQSGRPFGHDTPTDFVLDHVGKSDRRSRHLGDDRLDHQRLAIAGRRPIMHLRMHDDKHRSFGHEPCHRQPSIFEVVGPRSFKIFQVIGVVDDPAAVGTFVVYPYFN